MAQLGNTIINGVLRVNGDILGNTSTATKLQTARTIGVSGITGTAQPFDGTKNIVIPITAVPANLITGTVASATKAEQDFDGNVINTTYLKLSGGKMTGGLNFAGAQNITWADGSCQQRLKVTDDSTTNTNVFEFQQSTDSGATFKTLAAVKDNGQVTATTFVGALSGNASTATKLQTAKTINGVSFDGSANITIADSTKLPLTGGTLTTNTFNGLTIKRSDANGSSILFSNSAGNLGMVGFGNAGALVVTNKTGNAGTANMLMIGSDGKTTLYGTTQPNTNNVHSLGTSSLKWANVYATTFTGALSGNASTATKLATARTIEIDGSIEGSTTFDGSANKTITAKRRGAFVQQSTSTTTNPWYKVASVSNIGNYCDADIVFYVKDSYNSTNSGILNVHLRTGASAEHNNSFANWIVNYGYALEDFKIAYNADANPCTLELWTKIASAHMGRRFIVLSEGDRVSKDGVQWTLYETKSAGSQSAVTSGYAVKNSVNCTLSNAISSATKATQDSDGKTINTTYNKIDGTNTFIVLKGGNGNTTGYRVVLQQTLSTWTNCRMVLSVSSRHQGTGILSIGISTGGNLATFYQSARFFGSETSYTSDSWIQYYNSTTGVYSLLWKYSDYSETRVSILEKTGFGSTIVSGTWTETLDTATLGTKYTVKINEAQTATSATKATQDGNGSTISNTYLKLSGGNMTGNINFLSGDTSGIYWKENTFGDKFKITPAFGNADDNNKLQIQGAVGDTGTDPALYNLMTISGKSGNVWIKGSLNTGGDTIVNGTSTYPLLVFGSTSEESLLGVNTNGNVGIKGKIENNVGTVTASSDASVTNIRCMSASSYSSSSSSLPNGTLVVVY